MALRVKVRIEGIREVIAAFALLPKEAQDIVRDRSQDLAQSLIGPIQAAAAGQGRQAARAATSLKAARDRVPAITAGGSGSKLARSLVFGTEFGATRHFGWYNKGRYYNSHGRQFPAHSGAGSYWFFRTVDAESGRVSEAFLKMADEICEAWGSGA